MIQKGNKIIAATGTRFRRISDKELFGSEVCLGYTYFLGGEELPSPFLEKPEHFEEIPIDEDELVLIDEEASEAEPIVEERKITLADYKALEDKINKLMELLG